MFYRAGSCQRKAARVWRRRRDSVRFRSRECGTWVMLVVVLGFWCTQMSRVAAGETNAFLVSKLTCSAPRMMLLQACWYFAVDRSTTPTRHPSWAPSRRHTQGIVSIPSTSVCSDSENKAAKTTAAVCSCCAPHTEKPYPSLAQRRTFLSFSHSHRAPSRRRATSRLS